MAWVALVVGWVKLRCYRIVRQQLQHFGLRSRYGTTRHSAAHGRHSTPPTCRDRINRGRSHLSAADRPPPPPPPPAAAAAPLRRREDADTAAGTNATAAGRSAPRPSFSSLLSLLPASSFSESVDDLLLPVLPSLSALPSALSAFSFAAFLSFLALSFVFLPFSFSFSFSLSSWSSSLPSSSPRSPSGGSVRVTADLKPSR